jgi:flagellar P-ring protein precursor FlgI
MNRLRKILAPLLAAAVVLGGNVGSATATTVLRNICRVKGQEENVLRGLGLVMGLAGTGEAADAVTMRSLARTMEIMGAPVPEVPLAPGGGLEDLEKWKNVALVMVTARVPATGARRGDKIDCHVSALNGKSLAGGRLAFAALQGPNTQDGTIYATCEGAVHLEDPTKPLVGVISGGCQMEEDVSTPFHLDDRITLILDEHHASFTTAYEVQEAIYAQHSGEGEGFVRAVNAATIEVRIPDEYRDDPVSFAAEILEARIYSPEPEARVVINQKTNNIVIAGDVTIGDIVVSRNNVLVQAGEAAEFAALDPDQSDNAKLEALVSALNALKVPPADVVEIIKGIAQSGKLHGRLIIE